LNPSFSKYLWLIPAALALAVNLNVLQNGYVWDDKIQMDRRISTQEESRSVYGPSPGTPFFRPVISGLYSLEWRVWGDRPVGYHFSVLLFHILNTVLVYFVARRLFTGHPPGPAPPGSGETSNAGRNALRPYSFVPLVAAALFAVHPAHSEAVAWISGRYDVLVTFFLLLAVWAELRYLGGSGRFRTGAFFAAGLCLALLTKETALGFLPVFVILYWVQKAPRRSAIRVLKEPFFWILLAAFSGYWAYRFGSLGSFQGAVEWRWPSIWNAGTTVAVTVGYYLRLMLLPHPLNAFVLDLPRGGVESAMLLLLTGAFGAGLLWATLRLPSSVVTIGGWWFVFGIAPALLVPFSQNIHTPVAERYAYLPSAGFILMACDLVLRVRTATRNGLPIRPGPARWIPAGGILVLLAVLSAMTVTRNQVWRDSASLWEDTIRKSAAASIPHLSLGEIYERQGRLKEAEDQYRAALEGRGPRPFYANAATNLAIVLLQQRRFDRAEEAVRLGLARVPDHPILHYTEGMIHWEEAQQKGNDPSSGHPRSFYLDQARGPLSRAVAVDPRMAQAYYLLALVDLGLDRFEEARENFRKVVELEPDSPQGRFSREQLAVLPPPSK
jgi:tetratricopeptide (TPR) repeat protein